MSKVFVASAENFTIGTGRVLVAFRTAAAATTAAGVIGVRRIEIGQSGSTTSGMVRGALSLRDTAGTLTMTSNTPQPLSPAGGPASGLTGSTAPAGTASRIGTNSSADSGGAYTDLYNFNFNNLNGWLWIPTPQEVIEVPAASVFCVRFLADPATTSGWTISLTYEELS